jgi:hypothetical protein
MSTDPLSQLYKGKCHKINKIKHEKHLLHTVVLIKVLVYAVYLQSPIRLHGVVRNWLSTRTASDFTVPQPCEGKAEGKACKEEAIKNGKR